MSEAPYAIPPNPNQTGLRIYEYLILQQLSPKRPLIHELLGVFKWIWASGDNVIYDTDDYDAGGIKFRVREGQRAHGANITGNFRYAPRIPREVSDSGSDSDFNLDTKNTLDPSTTWRIVQLRASTSVLHSASHWLVDMEASGSLSKYNVTGELYWTRQPGDLKMDNDGFLTRTHTRLLCLRYPDPLKIVHTIELYGVPQLERKEQGIDGPKGYPPGEDYPHNDDYGNQFARLDEFGVGIARGGKNNSRWDHWLVKKGFQRSTWGIGLIINGASGGTDP